MKQKSWPTSGSGYASGPKGLGQWEGWKWGGVIGSVLEYGWGVWKQVVGCV